jgi:DNA invertase Pin-like site-specific DNA recombinase
LRHIALRTEAHSTPAALNCFYLKRISLIFVIVQFLKQVAASAAFVSFGRINAGLAAARDRGAKLGRPRTLDKHPAAVTKLRRRGFSGRKIAQKLDIPAGSVFAIMQNLKRAA